MARHKKQNEEAVETVEAPVEDEAGAVVVEDPVVVQPTPPPAPKAQAKKRAPVVRKRTCLKCNDSALSHDGSPFVCVLCGYEWE